MVLPISGRLLGGAAARAGTWPLARLPASFAFVCQIIRPGPWPWGTRHQTGIIPEIRVLDELTQIDALQALRRRPQRRAFIAARREVHNFNQFLGIGWRATEWGNAVPGPRIKQYQARKEYEVARYRKT
jgi:hypothetical protein